tara:strand:+ start:64 stop:324 length:261 start_codon:yes stop_codon:yes gene_type:complete
MNIIQLTSIIKEKIEKNIVTESVQVEDKTFLHQKHKSHQKGKFHLRVTIKSNELKEISKIESNKKIYKILNEEIKEYIHSIQILII